MKKQITILAVLAFIVTTVAANGNETTKEAQIRVIPGKNKVYKLIYPEQDSDKVVVTIKNETGKIIKRETIAHTDGFLRPYNFENMKEGTYTFEIKDGERTTSTQISLTNPKVLNVRNVESLKYRVWVEQRSKQPFSLNVYDITGKLIHSEKHEDTSGFTRLYDLNAVPSSTYTFELVGSNSSQQLTVN